MTIELNIPDDKKDVVIEAFAIEGLYDQNKQDGESKAAFAKRALVEYIKNIVISAAWNVDSNRTLVQMYQDVDEATRVEIT